MDLVFVLIKELVFMFWYLSNVQVMGHVLIKAFVFVSADSVQSNIFWPVNPPGAR